MMGISWRWLYSIGTYDTQAEGLRGSTEILRSLRRCVCKTLLPPSGKPKLLQYLCRQFPSIGGLAGRPGKRVSRATGHPVDLLALQRGNQPRPLDGVGGPVSELALIVISPCVNFSWGPRNRRAYCQAAATTDGTLHNYSYTLTFCQNMSII